MTKMPRAAVFDMDGLLLDSERVYIEAFHRATAAFGLPRDDHLYHQTIGLRKDAAMKVLHRLFSDKLNFDEFFQLFQAEKKKAFLHSIAVKPNVLELLERCSEVEIPVAVATSTHTNEATKRLDLSGIASKFQLIVGGDQVTHGKPSPDIYLRTARVLGVSPKACVAFEDSLNGLRAALSAGMVTVHVPDLLPPFQYSGLPDHLVAGTVLDGAIAAGLPIRH